MKSKFIAPVLLIAFLAINGCAGLTPRPEKTISGEAAYLLKRVSEFDSRITACKGVGTISIRSRSDMPRMRFAWLCRLPDRVRLELLAPTGTPLLTLSSDGDTFYFLPRDGNGRMRKEKAANVTLGKAIDVPMTVQETAHLLAGRVPLLDFDEAESIEATGGGDGLRLKRHRPAKTEIIFFDAGTGRPNRIEFLKGEEEALEYVASFEGEKAISGDTTIPEALILENSWGGTVEIEFSRFWPEQDLPVEKFVLTAP
jgi:outer membrane lipoprotein-sorting protein